MIHGKAFINQEIEEEIRLKKKLKFAYHIKQIML